MRRVETWRPPPQAITKTPASLAIHTQKVESRVYARARVGWNLHLFTPGGQMIKTSVAAARARIAAAASEKLTRSLLNLATPRRRAPCGQVEPSGRSSAPYAVGCCGQISPLTGAWG
jgi:hypothetical protein